MSRFLAICQLADVVRDALLQVAKILDLQWMHLSPLFDDRSVPIDAAFVGGGIGTRKDFRPVQLVATPADLACSAPCPCRGRTSDRPSPSATQCWPPSAPLVYSRR